jgi:glucose/arabinose dehydrogenase
MKLLSVLGLLIVCTSAAPSQEQPFTVEPVVTGLVVPWEIEFGRDGWLWTTERHGLFSRINLETGEKRVILDLRHEIKNENEVGMLGFTWHPDFPDSPYVYLAHVRPSGEEFYRIIERYTYVNDSLVDPVEYFRFDPAVNYHQGCRLMVGQDRKLYFTMGDSPGVDSANVNGPMIGKLVRMNLDGSVPEDNPVPGNLAWDKGHRNVQGLVQLPNGNIWTSEHGNVTEDEVNLIVRDANYGWPRVEGPCDTDAERAYCDSAGVLEPKWSSGASTVAPCGMFYYDHDRIPRLRNSLLMTTLKNGTLFQFVLNDSGTAIVETHEYLQRSIGRLRDVAISPDGRIFLCTSNIEWNSFPPFPLPEDDRIVELVAVESGTAGTLHGPDTVRTAARPGDRFNFPARVYNNGSAPLTVELAYNDTLGVSIGSDQWRVPVVILPNTHYDLTMVFEPRTEGEFTGSVVVQVKDWGFHRIKLFGTTAIGHLAPVEDWIDLSGGFGDTSEVDVWVTNDGVDTLTITGAQILPAPNDDVHVVSVETGVIAPQEQRRIVVSYHPFSDGDRLYTLDVLSTSYRPTRVTMMGTVVSSVQEPVSRIDTDRTAIQRIALTRGSALPIAPSLSLPISIMDIHGAAVGSSINDIPSLTEGMYIVRLPDRTVLLLITP